MHSPPLWAFFSLSSEAPQPLGGLAGQALLDLARGEREPG